MKYKITFQSLFEILFENKDSKNKGLQFEQDIARSINKSFKDRHIPLTAKRTGRTDYSDIEIKNHGRPIGWVETKLNPTDNLYNNRIHVVDGKFKYASGDEEIGEKICKRLNRTNSKGFQFLNNFALYLKNYINKHDSKKVSEFYKNNFPEGIENLNIEKIIKRINLSSSKKTPVKQNTIVPAIIVHDFITEVMQNNQYIAELKIDIRDALLYHYEFEKVEPAGYIQIDDNFFRLNDENEIVFVDPKNNTKIPLIPYINGTFKIRLTKRFDKKNPIGYEIVPELKATETDNLISIYSFKPETQKRIPVPVIF